MARITRRTGLLIVLLFLVATLWVVWESIDRVNVRVWLVDAGSEAPLPELADAHLAVPWLAERPSFGVAFSGGGTRSASATLGQLRALDRLGWLKKARYISSNSGGSWVTIPYTYLPANFDEQRFLGEYLPPERINDETLHPEVLDPLSMGWAIHHATTIGEAHELGRGDEGYSDIVGSIFLRPFGLHDNEKFFTFHRDARETTLAANPELGRSDFQIVEREDRPYLVVTGVMLGQQMSDDPEEYYPVDMTPLYTGIRGRFELDKDGETVVVGGGYVESFGYDSYEPLRKADSERYRVRLTGAVLRGDNPVSDRYRFTLSDMMGASSAAPLATLSRYGVVNILFPEFRHWPVDRHAIEHADERVRRAADEFQHGDGADMDNLALTPLLVRKTENIIVFINTELPFNKPAAGCGAVIEEVHITDDLVSYFRPTGVLVHNVIFDDEAGLEEICEAFHERQQAGQALVYCHNYDVIENERHGITPYNTNICWVHLDRARNWTDQLDPDGGELVRDLIAREGSFRNFPHYLTFAEQGVLLIDLNRERVKAATNFSAWTVLESAEYIATRLASAELPVPE
ncbi:MAG: patatin-like phospholipase family protein [Woeseiaceae bacterium]